MAFIFNPNKKRGVFMIPSGATKSPTPTPPSFTNTYSLAFDGIDDYVDTGITTTGTNDVSISCWIKTSETFAYSESRCAFGGSDVTFGANYTLGRLGSEFGSPNDMKVRVFNTFGTTKLNDNSWHNIIYTYNYTSKEVKVYVDGNTTPEISATVSLFRSKEIAIGWNGKTSSYHFEGNVDECAYFTSILGASDVTAIYNSGVPNDLSSISGLTNWYRNGDNGTWKSPQWLIPNNSNKDKVSNYSFAFDGVDDFINCGNPASLQITGALSISAWVKFTGNDMAIVTKANSSGSDRSFQLFGDRAGTTHRPVFVIWNSGTFYLTPDTGARVDDGNWHHLLATFNPSTYLRLYIDGNLEQENTTSIPATIDNDAVNFVIGATGNGAFHLSGNIDEVAVWNSDQSANIASIYNSGVPTTLPSGTVAHWKMGEQANFTSNWLVNNSALSNYSTRSFNFDGVDDYINLNTRTPNMTNFTLSFWLIWGGGNYKTIVGSDVVNQGGLLYAIVYEGGIIKYIDSSSGWTSLSNSITDGNWHHIAISYDDSTNTLKGYQNGSLVTTLNPDYSTRSTNAHSFKQIGARLSGSTFNEKLDEIAIYNTELSASDITSIYNSGTPARIEGAVSHWRMGEDATFNTNWSLPDNGSASNTGTSANMTISDLQGEAPNYTGGGLSNNMTIEDRVGDAPNSSNNAVSFNQVEADRKTDVPT